MTNLRKEARDRPCQIRLPGVCCHQRETTVLAHYRLPGLGGLGLKPDDLLGAWACHACHAYVDTHHDDATARAFLEGVLRTQNQLLREGLL